MGAETSRPPVESEGKDEMPSAAVPDAPLVVNDTEPEPAHGGEEVNDAKKCDLNPTAALLSNNKPTTHECKATASAPGHKCVLDSHMCDVVDSPHRGIPKEPESRPQPVEMEGSRSTHLTESVRKPTEKEELAAQSQPTRNGPDDQTLPFLPQLTQSGEIRFHLLGSDNLVQFDGSSAWCTGAAHDVPSVLAGVVAADKSFDNAEELSVLSLLADTTDSILECSDSLPSIIIPESFERDSATPKPKGDETLTSPTDTASERLEKCPPTLSIGIHLEAPPLLLPGSDASDLEHAKDPVGLASVSKDGFSIPVASTYADATNLAAKYPDLASKILLSPLQASGRSDASVSSPGNTVVVLTKAEDSEVQSLHRNNRERARRGHLNARQARGKKPAGRNEKMQVPSKQEGGTRFARPDRRLSSAGRTTFSTGTDRSVAIRPPSNATEVAMTRQSPAATGKEPASLQSSRRELPDTGLTRGYSHGRSKSRGSNGIQGAQALRLTPRRSVDVSMAVRATAEHAMKQSGPSAGLRYRDSQAASNRHTAAPDVRRIPERRPSSKPRTGYRGRDHVEGSQGQADHLHEALGDPMALRAYDCALGSHVLQGDDMVMPAPSITGINELQRQVMALRGQDIRQHGGLELSFNPLTYPHERQPTLHALQRTSSIPFRPAHDVTPTPFTRSLDVRTFPISGTGITDSREISGEQKQMARVEQMLLRTTGSAVEDSLGGTSFGGNADRRYQHHVQASGQEARTSARFGGAAIGSRSSSAQFSNRTAPVQATGAASTTYLSPAFQGSAQHQPQKPLGRGLGGTKSTTGLGRAGVWRNN
ncbi:hypothetical protein HYDPIDRAFT_23123 [Hydnomerulius pinastri MD-312]|nr:hypothetical protein HYDPIDRAFT_23123 [Hydnomerulius pinastri MD-312]